MGIESSCCIWKFTQDRFRLTYQHLRFWTKFSYVFFIESFNGCLRYLSVPNISSLKIELNTIKWFFVIAATVTLKFIPLFKFPFFSCYSVSYLLQLPPLFPHSLFLYYSASACLSLLLFPNLRSNCTPSYFIYFLTQHWPSCNQHCRVHSK